MACIRCVLFIISLTVAQVSSKPSYDSNNQEPSCDFIKTEQNGEIVSPNYPEKYPTGKDCSWTIMLPLFQKIVLVFETFKLEPVSSSEVTTTGCDRDYIEVFDHSKFLGRYCAGNIPPRQITSSSNMLRVVFKSDNRTIQGGFRGRFRAIYASCGGYYTETTGKLASPGYPSRFPADIQCHWRIRVPPDYVIQLSFKDFKMDGKYPCNVDYIKVLDGLNASDTEIGHFCSTRPPQKTLIRSTGNKMSLEFKSHKESNFQRFEAHYSRVPHCTGFLESDYGRFTSPGYPGSRKMDKECDWVITVSEGKIASLMFESFDVDSKMSTFSTPGDCKDDYVEVFDGPGDSDNSLGRFCTINNKPLGMVRSTGRQMLVRLKTSFKNNGNGFLASYYGIDPNNYFADCDVFDDKLLFTCKSGKRIQCQLKCDGTNDCSDASDERHCKHTLISTTQKSNDIRNYVIVILAITGSALSVICISFIVDRLRKKRTTRTRRRICRQRRPHLRISAVDDAPFTEEPSSPPPPYELIASRNTCDAFDVCINQPHFSGLHPSPNTGESRQETVETQNGINNQTQSQDLVLGNQESTSNILAQEITNTTFTAQLALQETPTVNVLEEADSISIQERRGTISPSESISSFNDTTPLIRSDSVIEV